MTEPLPWTGAMRSMQEIEDHKPAMERWIENQKHLSMSRLKRLGMRYNLTPRNRGTDRAKLINIFNGS